MKTFNNQGRGVENGPFNNGGRGAEKGPVGSNGVENKEKAIDNVKNSAKTMITSIFWAAAIVATESIAIWWIWNYIIPEHPMSYVKTYLGVIMIRLILRSTAKLSDLKK